MDPLGTKLLIDARIEALRIRRPRPGGRGNLSLEEA